MKGCIILGRKEAIMANLTRLFVLVVLASFFNFNGSAYAGPKKLTAEEAAQVVATATALLGRIQTRLEVLREQYDILNSMTSAEKTPQIVEEMVSTRAEILKLEDEQKNTLEIVNELDTPERREARAKVRKDLKARERSDQNLVDSLVRANIEGCDPDTMFVNPAATQARPNKKMLGQVTIRVHNTRNFSVSNIETSFRSLGVAVENLCAGGSLTLSFVLKDADAFLTPYLSGTLTAKDSRGNIVGSPFSFTLVNYNANQRGSWNNNYRHEALDWEIR